MAGDSDEALLIAAEGDGEFRERVSNAEELTSDSGNVFQRLDHTAALFSEHAGVDLIAIAGQGRWQDLRSRSRPARAHPRRRDRR